MKIVIHLSRDPNNLPAVIQTQDGIHTYPECRKHATDVIIWLVTQIQQKKPDLHIITQSEHIVNYLGHLIEQKRVNKDDVLIKIYGDLNTECRYDENGVLITWHFGWFGPNFDEADELFNHE